MDRFERDYIYPNPIFQQLALTWVRYTDDIFCTWQGDQTSLLEFYNHINTIRPELTFSLSYHADAFTFLDTKVLKDTSGTLSTDIYTKPMDCNSLLLYSSCHPKATKNSLPRSQFKKVTKIVSHPRMRETRLHEMAEKFKIRDNQPQLLNLIRRHWPLLNKAYPNIKIFKNPPLVCTKRPKNLRDTLVRADLGPCKPTSTRSLSRQRTGTFPCLSCMSCSNVFKGKDVVHPRTGKTYPIKDYYTYESNFVVYIIKCLCGLLYVGETTQAIRDRISSHKSTIRCEKLWLPYRPTSRRPSTTWSN
ncbi:unnamed protein product [Ranitomeya imitator]|uniref:GIY-YIG domain-containing protein n=1 Tax=Ranitomeya imitator TaxID=111125 RepID=A0ABN9M8F4_9NEOB|nr:unnamed protein product [Ranitomeya imitator]